MDGYLITENIVNRRGHCGNHFDELIAVVGFILNILAVGIGAPRTAATVAVALVLIVDGTIACIFGCNQLVLHQFGKVRFATENHIGTRNAPGLEHFFALLGFKEAPVIEQGQLVEGLGGGACQVSSTVHAAALLTGLDIVERYNHSLPSSYIARGMDAVVSYPVLDLRVRNTLEHPIVLRVRTENNTLTAQFYSDAPRESRVLFRQEVAAEIPFKEIISVDPALDPGTIRITKRGKVGYRVLRSRITLRHGEETYEKFLDDTYQPQTQYVSVAPDAIYPVPPEDAVEDEDNV